MPITDTLLRLAALAGLALLGVRVGLSCLDWCRRSWRRRQWFARDRERFELEWKRAALRLKTDEEKVRNTWTGYRKFEVRRKNTENETGDICSFYLWPHDERPLPPFQPGQFLTFEFRIPGSGKRVTRCYSLSDRPNPDYYRISVKRLEDGVASGYLHEKVLEGGLLDVRAPGGSFCIDPLDSSPLVLLGGGVGITPFLSMAYEHCQASAAREIWLFYGVRSEKELMEREKLASLAEEHDHFHFHSCFSREVPPQALPGETVHEGRITKELLEETLPSSSYDFYMCASAKMMDSLKEQLLSWGVDKERIHWEAFGGEALPKPSGGKAAPEVAITFSNTGESRDWSSEYGSLLDLAEDAGAAIDCGCRRGGCGCCQTAIVEGEFEYVADPEFPDVKEGCFLPCIAVPKTPMTLEG